MVARIFMFSLGVDGKSARCRTEERYQRIPR